MVCLQPVLFISNSPISPLPISAALVRVPAASTAALPWEPPLEWQAGGGGPCAPGSFHPAPRSPRAPPSGLELGLQRSHWASSGLACLLHTPSGGQLCGPETQTLPPPTRQAHSHALLRASERCSPEPGTLNRGCRGRVGGASLGAPAPQFGQPDAPKGQGGSLGLGRELEDFLEAQTLSGMLAGGGMAAPFAPQGQLRSQGTAAISGSRCR